MTQFQFEIDQVQSERTNTLTIIMSHREKKCAGSSQSFLQLANAPHEKEIIQNLIHAETHFQKGINKTGPLFIEAFHLPYSKVQKMLQLMAGAGKIVFKQRQIICDFFSKVKCHYHLNQNQEGKVDISLTVEGSGLPPDLNIKDCDFVCCGPPHFFIKGSFLKFMATEIPWKQIKQALSSSWTIDVLQIQNFLEENTDSNDPDAPLATVQISQPLHQAIPSPLPILKLKDRLGAFADLLMSYGTDYVIDFHHPNSDVRDIKGKSLFKRDQEQEKLWEKDLLETGFIKKFVGNSHYFCPLDQVGKSLSFLLDIGWTIHDFKGNRLVKMGNLSLHVQPSPQAYKIEGKASFDQYEMDIEKVAGAFNRREKFIELSSNTTGLLPDKWENSALETLSDEGEIIQGGVLLKKSKLGSLASLFSLPNIEYDTSLESLKERLESFSVPFTIPTSSAFLGTLRPYQQEGLNWLLFLKEMGLHGLLADEMGLGKTVQVLSFLISAPEAFPALIVLPSSLLFNWKKEIERFIPSVSVVLFHGAEKIKTEQKLQDAAIILTSYTTLRLNLSLFESLSFNCLILDEAQTIKNSSTQAAQAIYRLKANFRLAITGTPIENHLGELWSLFHFLLPELLGNQDSFAAEISASMSDSRYLKRIKQKIRPFMLRRTKVEVAQDLPQKIDQTVWVEMTSSQRQIYDDYLAGIKGNLLKKVEIEGVAKNRIEILEAILRLRQICCHPLLISGSLEQDIPLESAKIELLLTDLEVIVEEGKKALIYSQFTSMLSILAQVMIQKGWSFVTLDGSTSNREKVVTQFQEDEKIPFFLISLKAGGVGLNLTAADYVFLYEPWWNEAVENQAIDRVHRIGKKETVTAKRYIIAESIEERIFKLKKAKSALSDDLLEGALTNSQLTEEDFKFLLS